MCRTPRRKDFHSHSPMNIFAWSLISPKKRRNSLIPSFLRSVLSRTSQPPNILANPKKAPPVQEGEEIENGYVFWSERIPQTIATILLVVVTTHAAAALPIHRRLPDYVRRRIPIIAVIVVDASIGMASGDKDIGVLLSQDLIIHQCQINHALNMIAQIRYITSIK